ncbi:MAG: alkyl sulfatase C-terminal domain-containing protein [Bacillota bacterium]
MKNYDCIIIGNDLYALTVALFLSRKMRKILLIENPSPYIETKERKTITIDKEKYNFNYSSDNVITGLNENGLLNEFLDNLGLLYELDFDEIQEEVIFDKDMRKKYRKTNFKDFKIYLMRYYPKSIKSINRFFADLERHYQNYTEQYLNLLHNNDYTLTSLMIEWGDYSLNELLNKYFDDEKLINEFRLNNFINGLNSNEVGAYNFFANYFVGLKTGFFNLNTSVTSLRNKITKKIKTSNKNSIIKTKITSFKVNKQKIEYIEDSKGKQYSAKYFFVSDQPIEFYNDYFTNIESDLEQINKFYPNLETNIYKRTMYFVVDCKLEDCDITDLYYYINNNEGYNEKIIRLFNYSLANNNQDKDYGMLCLDFSYNIETGFKEENLIERLYSAFPKLKKKAIKVSYGKEKQYLSMIRDEKIRKNFSINELIDYESLNHINIFENLYIGGDFIRPESGFYGKIHQAITTGDKIEDFLYFKDKEDEDFYYSNDEVMMMLRQNYDYSYFGKKEIHINFHIGKNIYFFRMKAKNIVIHRGKYNSPDLSIYTTNDRLIELILKKKPYKEVIESEFFKYKGDKNVLERFLKAFDLDDKNKLSVGKIFITPFKNFGMKFFHLIILVFSITAFLANYFKGLYIYFPALLVTLALTIYKYKVIKKINVLEYIINLTLFIFGIVSIFSTTVNTLYSDDILLAVLALAFFGSVIYNRPFVKQYFKFDYNPEFVQTNLFSAITNGLSFIWGFIFLSILLGTYITGERYVSVLYHFIFIGFFLSYYYPTIYVKTSIKKL